jgi:hypothetical protein
LLGDFQLCDKPRFVHAGIIIEYHVSEIRIAIRQSFKYFCFHHANAFESAKILFFWEMGNIFKFLTEYLGNYLYDFAGQTAFTVCPHIHYIP